MTNEKCPMCDGELRKIDLFDWLSCPNCNYTKFPNDAFYLQDGRIIYKIAEILQELADGILNLNTDEEIEEMESQIEKCRSLLHQMEKKNRTDSLDEVDDNPTYPSPGSPPKNPGKPKSGDIVWQGWNDTGTRSDADSFLSSGNYSTSEKLDELEEIIKETVEDD